MTLCFYFISLLPLRSPHIYPAPPAHQAPAERSRSCPSGVCPCPRAPCPRVGPASRQARRTPLPQSSVRTSSSSSPKSNDGPERQKSICKLQRQHAQQQQRMPSQRMRSMLGVLRAEVRVRLNRPFTRLSAMMESTLGRLGEPSSRRDAFQRSVPARFIGSARAAGGRLHKFSDQVLREHQGSHGPLCGMHRPRRLLHAPDGAHLVHSSSALPSVR